MIKTFPSEFNYPENLRSNMVSTFHWVKIKAICHATENEDLIMETIKQLTGADGKRISVNIADGTFNAPLSVIDVELTHVKECETLFRNLGKEILESIIPEIEERTDDDDMFFLRLNKQKAVQGKYEIAHGSDVISITAKIAAHPAKKEVAVKIMNEFLQSLIE